MTRLALLYGIGKSTAGAVINDTVDVLKFMPVPKPEHHQVPYEKEVAQCDERAQGTKWTVTIRWSY